MLHNPYTKIAGMSHLRRLMRQDPNTMPAALRNAPDYMRMDALNYMRHVNAPIAGVSQGASEIAGDALRHIRNTLKSPKPITLQDRIQEAEKRLASMLQMSTAARNNNFKLPAGTLPDDVEVLTPVGLLLRERRKAQI